MPNKPKPKLDGQLDDGHPLALIVHSAELPDSPAQ